MKFLSLLSAFFLFSTPALAVWPRPQSMTTGSTALRLAPNFSINLSGIHQPPQDLSDAVQRSLSHLKTDKHRALEQDSGAPSAEAMKSASTLRSLSLQLTSNSGRVASISEGAMAGIGAQDESYTLQVPADGGDAVLTANTALGLFRGLTTFEQLWYDLSGSAYTPQAPIQVKDAPAYPYRGFMLDTARNYSPVADIKRTLDAMSWVKINHFHWHIIGSQSFPLVVPGFEELSQKGAANPSQVYTPNDVKDLVAYAAVRGIDIVIEIDIPGQAAAISQSHPEHVACASEHLAGQLRFANSETTKFTANLIKAVSSLFPSKLFSTGGDELDQNCPQTQQDLQSSGKTLDQALNTFTQATQGVLAVAGKTPIVWEEMVLGHPINLRNDTITLVSSDHAGAVAQKGLRFIHAASNLDLGCGTGDFLDVDTNANSWCDPFKTWQESYSFNPTAGLTGDQVKLVLGGQQLLWPEQTMPSSLDSISWPHAASFAELFWSGAAGDIQSGLSRLHNVAFRIVQRGDRTTAIQPTWCVIHPPLC